MCKIQTLRYKDGELAYYMDHRQDLREKILKCLEWLDSGLAEQGWKNIKSPASLVDTVLDEFTILEVGNTLVAFTVGQPWFIDGTVIAEEFIAPFANPPAPISEVVRALELVGESAGCVMLSLGTRANPRQQGLARLFEQTGAKLSTIELVKEIHHGKSL